MDALVAEYGEEDVMRWCETGRLVEQILPRFVERGHGGLAYTNMNANPWRVNWATFGHWEGEKGGWRFSVDTLERMDERRGATPLAALQAAQE